MLGQQVRNYRIESLLGTGGMGSVYLAVHTQLGRKIAIKVLHPTLTGNPGIRERFRNEAATLSHLHHPNIVTLYDYWEEEDKLYLFLEYVEGKPLDEYIQTISGPIPEAKAVPLFSKILEAVAYAHDKGVIHRDIKPSNIIINDFGNPKILDFGIAKLIGPGVSNMTKTGTRMGTVLYMSPEQVRGESLDKQSDVYSLGVTLFQILTGRSPYEGDTLSEYLVYQKILNEPLPQMQSLYPGVSAWMQQIVDNATAKNPIERFQDCHSFREALAVGVNQDHLKVIAAPAASGMSPAAHTAAPAPVPNHQLKDTVLNNPRQTKVDSQTKVESPKRGTPWLAVLLGAGVLLSLLGVILALLPENRQVSYKNPPPIVETNQATDKRQDSQANETEEANENIHTAPTVGDSMADAPVVQPDHSSASPTVGAEALSNIDLAYEAVPPSEDVTSRFALLIVLTNKASNIAFDNVTLRIRFLDENNQVIGTYLYEHGRLEAGAVERFNIERRVRAVSASCELVSAEAKTQPE